MKKFITIIILISFSYSVFGAGPRPELTVDVKLSPAGSFQIVSKRIRGRVFEDPDGKIKANNIKIPVKSLETGVSLRDEHLHEKLGHKDQEAYLILIEASGKDANGMAKFMVNEKTQEVPFKYERLNKKLGKAVFNLKLDGFGITGISYMGVGVENVVDVTVILPMIKK